ncbi:MAG: NYN domain-containing protein [Acidobacteria bacterium]|nr:NYN domain-containing protein [Acidobacteriota bacterium]
MNITPDNPSTRIAVFIDFDNVEIGVKNTIGGQFDIGLVLDAIKERGEIVTKIAYSDWKRSADYSRSMTQHAIRMVQRNVTPGGDKNGADITMALDALELAFTHNHINMFVIVGGDSDFISLVEKLKQYGRKVLVVGGRQFTSVTMQKNCHEFIAYENLAGTRGGPRHATRGVRPSTGTAATPVADALPLVRRALKVLSDREVTPQLGLLKSTLLQLDSTFSEREYGAGSFRDFMEKIAESGAVTLRHAGRNILVESREDGAGPVPEPGAAAPEPAAPVETDGDEETLPPSPMTLQDGIRAVQKAFGEASPQPRWPLYVRQAKQFLRTAIDGFDERNYGYASVVDLLRAAGKDGVLRVERDRHGAIRAFPGPRLGRSSVAEAVEVTESAEAAESAVDVRSVRLQPDLDADSAEPVEDAPVVDAQPVEETETPPAEPAKRGGRKRKTAGKPAARAGGAKAARPRARRTVTAKDAAADGRE